MSPVTAESIRSRQTGHVGNSTTEPRDPDLREITGEAVSSVSMMTEETWTMLHNSG